MKKAFFLFIFAFTIPLFAQAELDELPDSERFFAVEDSADDSGEDSLDGVKASKGGYAEVPPAKRPLPIDKEKAKAAAAKDENNEEEEDTEDQED